MSPPARLLHALVRLYRRLTAHRPSPCRFDPTCSGYALDALERHGALRGTWLTARRLARCHPWGGQGWDPVPPTTDPPSRSRPISASPGAASGVGSINTTQVKV